MKKSYVHLRKKIIIFKPYILILSILIVWLDYLVLYNSGREKLVFLLIKGIVIFLLLFDYFYMFINNPTINFFKKNLRYLCLILIFVFGYKLSGDASSRLISYFNIPYIHKIDITYQVFCLIMYPLIYTALIFSLLLKYKSFMHKNRTYFVLVAYLVTWIWFGYFYHYYSIRNDNSFVINERQNSKNVLYGLSKNKTISSGQEDSLKKILDEKLYLKNVYPLPIDKYENYLADNQIGVSWGRFYEEKLVNEGFTQYTLNILPDLKIIDKTILTANNDDFDWYSLVGQSYYQVEVNLYKEGKSEMFLKYVQAKNIQKKPAYKVVLLLKKDELISFTNTVYQERKPLYYLLGKSHTLIGDEIFIIRNAINGSTAQPIIDYLYFSAVTITTLGYGDMTPDAEIVRVFIMIESFLGVILMGLFITFVTTQHKSKH